MDSSRGLHLSKQSPSRLEALPGRLCRVGERTGATWSLGTQSASQRTGSSATLCTEQRSRRLPPRSPAPGRTSSAATPAPLPSAREGRPFSRERVIDGPAPPSSARQRTRAVCFGSGATGRERVTPGAANAALPSPPGLRPQQGGRDGQGGAAGSGSRARGGALSRVEAQGGEPGGGCSRPAPRPRRASRDRSSRRGGARLGGIMSVCQAGPG